MPRQDAVSSRFVGSDMRVDDAGDSVAVAGSRNGYSNLMRVLAAFGVICGHVATRAIYSDPNPSDPQWLFSAYFGVYCLWTLPCFIMISGDMFAARGQPTMAMWTRRIGRIGVLTAAAAAFFIFISWAVRRDLGEIGFVSAALGGPPFEHLWYMYFIVGLYALAPWLMRILEVTPGRVFEVTMVLLFLASAYGALPEQPAWMKISLGLCLISYFLIGAHMRALPRPTPVEGVIWATVFVLAGVMAGYIGTHMVQPYGIFAAFGFAGSLGGPAAALMAIAVFRLVHFLPAPMWSARLAPATFIIYIIHPLWIVGLEKLGFTVAWQGQMIGLPLFCITVFAASAISALALRWLKQKALGVLPSLRWRLHFPDAS